MIGIPTAVGYSVSIPNSTLQHVYAQTVAATERNWQHGISLDWIGEADRLVWPVVERTELPTHLITSLALVDANGTRYARQVQASFPAQL